MQFNSYFLFEQEIIQNVQISFLQEIHSSTTIYNVYGENVFMQ